MLNESRLMALMVAFGVSFMSVSVRAQPVADFYRGKVLTLVIGAEVSGEYNQTGRLLARHFGKYVPGNPTIVVQNIPGASGIKAANTLYAVAPRDGSTIGLANSRMVFYEMTDGENATYKSLAFKWIGSINHSNDLVLTWAGSGIKTLADAKKREVMMGSTGAGGALTSNPVILNNAIGTRFKIVLGYAGSQVVDLAMERGEIEGRGSFPWSDLKNLHGDWIRDGKLNILAQYGLSKEPDLPNVPLVTELGHDDFENKVFTFIASPVGMGKPFMTPPAVSDDRVAALREAFDKTMKDEEFLADARKARIEVSPIDGKALESLVHQTIETPPEIVSTAKQWMTRRP